MNRYFKGIGESSGAEWKAAAGQIYIRQGNSTWEESSFASVKELRACLDTVECDEDFEQLKMSAEDIAAEKGDRAFKLAQEENA